MGKTQKQQHVKRDGPGNMRHRHQVKLARVDGIPSATFRRQAHRGGAVFISPSAFMPARAAMTKMLDNVLKGALIDAMHDRRRTIKAGDVRRAFRGKGGYEFYGP